MDWAFKMHNWSVCFGYFDILGSIRLSVSENDELSVEKNRMMLYHAQPDLPKSSKLKLSVARQYICVMVHSLDEQVQRLVLQTI